MQEMNLQDCSLDMEDNLQMKKSANAVTSIEQR